MGGVSFFRDLVQVLTLFCFSVIVQCIFSRQAVALSGDSVPPDWFSQARCLVMLIPVKNFPGQSVTIKGELVQLELFWHTSSSIHLTSFLNVYSRFLKQRKLICNSLTVGNSLCVWSFFLWSFHIGYKVMSSSCYIFSPLFLFHWFSQVVTIFTSCSETYALLLLLKFLPSNGAKLLIVKNAEHKLE